MGADDDLPGPGNFAGGDASRSLEERVARLERELDALRRQIAGVKPADAAVLARAVTWQPAAARTLPPAAARTLPPAAEPEGPPVAPGVAPPAPPPPTWTGGKWNYPVSAPVAASSQRDSFENRLGSQIFNRIGIVLLMIGTAWFLKYAVDREWIGPRGRVLAGLLAGAGIVLWSERFRKNGFAAFSYSLKALGSGVLYLSLWAAFQIYHLLPAPAALGLMILVTAWNAYMAWVQNSELLAAYALAGGFATPMLLSTGGNHETFLFTYLLAIDVATVVLVRLRGWPRLLIGAFPATVGFFIGWYAEFYTASELALTSVFIVLFDSTFSSVALGRRAVVEGVDSAASRRKRATVIEEILLPLANAAFLSLAFYSVLQDSGHHDLVAWLMLLLAAVYLGFMRLPQSRTVAAIHLSIAMVFLTIAIPLKASGHWITVSWLVEGLALLWVSTRLAPALPPVDESEDYASATLRWLASGALLLGFCGVLVHWLDSGFGTATHFFNANMATAITGIAVFAGVAWLGLQAGREKSAVHWMHVATSAFLAIVLLALLLAFREVAGISPAVLHPPFQTPNFGSALLGLGVLAGVIAVALRLAKAHPETSFWRSCTALSTIAFNVVALLTGVREIDALWDLSAGNAAANADAGLQQALAISGFLMLYGAALLAVGFWKRSAFLRWQALLLLVFTIFKAFLYDMRNLSQGYRVVSFLALGALLMTISFAYQKDWLNLREPEAAEAERPEALR